MTIWKRARKGFAKKFKKRYGTFSNPKIGQVARDVAFLKSVINVERKFLDLTQTGIALQAGTTATIILLNGMSEGSTNNTRNGQSIKMSSICIQGTISLVGTVVDTIKMGIFMFPRPSEADPTVADIWTIGGTFPNAFRSENSVDNYRVIKQLKITLSPNGTMSRNFKIFCKVKQHVKYDSGNAGTIADIRSNAMYFYYGGDVVSNMSYIKYSTRLRYIDN